MMFKDSEIQILKNFAGINPSMLIKPDVLEVINNSKSVVAKYSFEKPYTYGAFGIYEVPNLLAVLGSLSKPEMDVKDKFIQIKDGTYSGKYWTTADNLLPKVPDVEEKFSKLDCALEFDISNEKLQMLFKMAAVMKATYLFFETDKKKIRLTAADELEASNNSFEVILEDGIKKNNLAKPVKIPIAEMKLYGGDYKVKLSDKISKWSNTIGNLDYYIGCAVVASNAKTGN